MTLLKLYHYLVPLGWLALVGICLGLLRLLASGPVFK